MTSSQELALTAAREVERLAAHMPPSVIRHRAMVKALALGIKSQAQIARDFDVTRGAVTLFRQRNAREIDDMKVALADEVRKELAGLWIASQENRIAAYQEIYSTALDERTQLAALRAVAEELGQIAPRSTVTVVPVVHVIEGIDMETLR